MDDRMTRAGDELPELRRVVTREDVRVYADVSGDLNPLHQDDGFARSVGFAGIIAHGMFTMAHMAACVVAWAGDAEPDAEERLEAVAWPLEELDGAIEECADAKSLIGLLLFRELRRPGA